MYVHIHVWVYLSSNYFIYLWHLFRMRSTWILRTVNWDRDTIPLLLRMSIIRLVNLIALINFLPLDWKKPYAKRKN